MPPKRQLQSKESDEKHKHRSVNDRYQMIKLIEGRRLSQRDAAAYFKVSKGMIQGLIEDRKKIIDHVESEKNSSVSHIYNPRFENVDRAAYAWFVATRKKGLPLSGLIVRGQALQLALLMHCNDFLGSEGWWDGFARRYNIKLKECAGAESLVDEVTVQQFTVKIAQKRQQYSARDTYNIDETGCYWRLLPTKSYVLPGETGKDVTISKDRFTILFGVNADGSHKLDPVVIHTAETPLCMKNIDKKKLGVEWYKAKKGWMNTSIFTDYMLKLDDEFSRKKRKVLFVLDNVSSHANISSKLQNIELLFLPPNTTSRLQPLDAGIIRSFKAKYKRNLMVKLIQAMQNADSAKELISSITILDAVKMLVDSWREIIPDIIINCFRRAGFKFDAEIEIVTNADDAENTDEKDLANMLNEFGSDVTIEQYMTAETESEIHEPNNKEPVDLEEIADMCMPEVAAVVSAESDVDVDADSVQVVQPKVTLVQAAAAFDQLKNYWQQESCMSSLKLVEEEILKRKWGSLRQKRITDFK